MGEFSQGVIGHRVDRLRGRIAAQGESVPSLRLVYGVLNGSPTSIDSQKTETVHHAVNEPERGHGSSSRSGSTKETTNAPTRARRARSHAVAASGKTGADDGGPGSDEGGREYFQSSARGVHRWSLIQLKSGKS
jgi:hypothetical protein